MPLADPSLRALFAARLVQARQLRGLSQRALGDQMGLGKDKGSSRINRYEHQVTAIGFENLETLAKVLNVPPAYLLADGPEMADAILAVADANPPHQAQLAQVLAVLSGNPTLTKALLKALAQQSPKTLKDALASLSQNPAGR